MLANGDWVAMSSGKTGTKVLINAGSEITELRTEDVVDDIRTFGAFQMCTRANLGPDYKQPPH